MSMRISSILAITLLLSACGKEPEAAQDSALQPANGLAAAEADAQRKAADDGMIDCAVSGMTTFMRTCVVEREYAEDGLFLTIRHDDGGFRRFKVLTDGRGVVAADGAEPAIVHTIGERAIEVQVAGDKYRLPATVKSSKAVAPVAPSAPTAVPKP